VWDLKWGKALKFDTYSGLEFDQAFQQNEYYRLRLHMNSPAKSELLNFQVERTILLAAATSYNLN